MELGILASVLVVLACPVGMGVIIRDAIVSQARS